MVAGSMAGLLACWLIAGRCGDVLPDLRIERIDGATQVLARDSARLQAVVSGVEPYRYQWYCSRGRLAWDDRNWVIWWAPDTSGSADVIVSVEDTMSRSVAETLRVIVKVRRNRLRDLDGAVKPATHIAWPDTLRAGYQLTAYTAGDTGLVFLVLDSTNYAAWRRGAAYDCLVRRQAYVTRPATVTIPANGRYYSAFDNTLGQVALGFRLWLDVQSP